MRIKKCFLKNFKGLKNFNYELDLNFEDKDKIILLWGENGIGKTTILESLHPYPFMITRSINKSVIYPAYKEVIWEHKNTVYKTEIRFISDKETKCYLYKKTNGEFELVKNTEKGNLKTYLEELAYVLEPQDKFKDTFMAQGVLKIVEASPSQRLEIINKFMPSLEIYDRHKEYAKTKEKETNAEIKALKEQLNNYVKYEKEYKRIKQEEKLYTDENYKNAKKEKNELKKRYEELIKLSSKIDGLKEQINGLKEKTDKFFGKIKYKEDVISQLNSLPKNIEKQITELEEKLQKIRKIKTYFSGIIDEKQILFYLDLKKLEKIKDFILQNENLIEDYFDKSLLLKSIEKRREGILSEIESLKKDLPTDKETEYMEIVVTNQNVYESIPLITEEYLKRDFSLTELEKQIKQTEEKEIELKTKLEMTKNELDSLEIGDKKEIEKLFEYKKELKTIPQNIQTRLEELKQKLDKSEKILFYKENINKNLAIYFYPLSLNEAKKIYQEMESQKQDILKLIELNKKIEFLKEELKKVPNIQSLPFDLKDFYKNIPFVYEELQQLHAPLLANLEDLKAKLEKLKEEYTVNQEKKNQIKRELEKISEILQETENIKNFNIKEINKDILKLNNLTIRGDELKNVLNNIKGKNVCPLCGQDIKEDHKEHLKRELDKIYKEMKKIKSKYPFDLEKVKTLLEERNNALKRKEELNKQLKTIRQIDGNEIKELEYKIRQAELTKRITNYIPFENIEEAQKIAKQFDKKTIENFIKIDEKNKQYEKQKKELKDRIHALEKEKTNLNISEKIFSYLTPEYSLEEYLNNLKTITNLEKLLPINNENTVEELFKSLDSFVKQIPSLKEKIKNLERQTERREYLKEKINFLEKAEKLIREKNAYEKEIFKLKQKHSALEKDFEIYTVIDLLKQKNKLSDFKDIKQIVSNYTYEEIREILKKKEVLFSKTETLQKIEKEILDLTKKLRNIEKQYPLIKELTPEYKMLPPQINSIIKMAEITKGIRIKTILERGKKIAKEEDSVTKQYDKLRESLKLKQKLEKNLDIIEEYEQIYKENKELLKTKEKELDALQKNFSYQEIENVKRNIEEIDSFIENYNEFKVRKQNIEKIIEDYKRIQKKLEQVQKRNFQWKRIKIASDKIKKAEISLYFKDIISIANRLLENDEVTIKIKLAIKQITDKTFNIYAKDGYKGNEIEDISLLSGAEKASVQKALSIALAEKSNIKTLWIDEADASLSSKNKELFLDMIDKISSDFDQIFLVSHYEGAKKIADKILP